jgi:hypothetical protein
MGQVLKVLGQSSPAAATLTALYTVPALTSVAVSSIVVSNRNAAKIKFRVSVAIGGAADTGAQYLYFDVEVNGNDTFVATIGITLATTDVVRVQTNTTLVGFNLFGAEVTA